MVEFGNSGYTSENVDLEGLRYITQILVLFRIQYTLLNKIIMNSEEIYRLIFQCIQNGHFFGI